MSDLQFLQRSRVHQRVLLRLFGLFLIAALLLSSIGALAAPLAANSASVNEVIAPPWCGTPEPDGVGSLPDGTNPGDLPGSFPHIPYYAIGCTLADIQARSNGRMEVRVFGQSALGKDMYLVTLNALDTPTQRKDFQTWLNMRKIALTEPGARPGDARPTGLAWM